MTIILSVSFFAGVIITDENQNVAGPNLQYFKIAGASRCLRNQRADEKKREIKCRRVKTVVPNKTANFDRRDSLCHTGSDLLRPTEPRLRVFDIDIAFFNGPLLILNFLKTPMRAIRTCVCR